MQTDNGTVFSLVDTVSLLLSHGFVPGMLIGINPRPSCLTELPYYRLSMRCLEHILETAQLLQRKKLIAKILDTGYVRRGCIHIIIRYRMCNVSARLSRRYATFNMSTTLA